MMTDNENRPRRSGVQSIEIGGRLLEALVNIGRPATLTEVSRATGLPTAKAHRYLSSLSESGLTLQDTRSGRYGLGPLAVRLGISAIAQHDVLERAFESLETLCTELATSGHLSVWSEAGPVVVRSAHGGPPVISPVTVGVVLPLLQSASGLVYLAFMSEDVADEVARRQPGYSETKKQQLLRDAALIRKRRYAIASGRYIPGLYAIALPVLDINKSLVAVMTFVSTDAGAFTPKSHMTKRALQVVDDFNKLWSAD